MVEILFKKIASRLSSNSQGKMPRTKGSDPRVYIVAAVVLLVAVKDLPNVYDHYAGHRREIADAVGSVGLIFGTPQPSRFGSRVAYVETAEDGIGVFMCDAGKKPVLCADPHLQYIAVHDQVSPFSPDDRLFAYSIDTEVNGPSGLIGIYDTITGKELTEIYRSEYVDGMAWLDPKTLVWLGRIQWTRTGPGFHLHVIKEAADGTWSNSDPDLELTNASCLSALSSNTCAWLDAGGIRALDLDSGSVSTLFEPAGRLITGFCYSSGEFLITSRERQQSSLWQLKLNSDGTPGDFEQLGADSDIQDARWINGGAGYAYLDHNQLVVRPSAEDQPVRLMDADVDSFEAAPDGRSLVLAADVGNDAWGGIWRYDVGSGSLTNIVSYSDYPSSFASRVEYSHCVLRTRSGESLDYYVYPPAPFDRQKKYPMVIGDMVVNTENMNNFRGPSYLTVLADCGAYVVIVNRKTSWNVDEWERNFLIVYKKLIADGGIDAGRVYLCGASATTPYTSKFIEEMPNLWTGVIFNNPIDLPNPTALEAGQRLPRILISAGAEEEEAGWLDKFQKTACGRGMEVDVQEIPNTGHIVISKFGLRERSRAAVAFVFGQ